MSVIKIQLKAEAILTRSVETEIDDYAKGLRRGYETHEWLRKGRRPLDLKTIQLKIDTLKEAEAILRQSANSRLMSERRLSPTKILYQPGFMMVRRWRAAGVLKSEANRLSRLKRRHEDLHHFGPGRPPDPLWGYRANCLADFIKEKTGKRHWNLVGAMLVKHFPEAYAPASQPGRDALGPWACTLAKRFRRLRDKDPSRYTRIVGLT